ncbi:MAG: LysR family transcriptional regulator [Oscillospiraceae bacterium]|jgi:DNA-binding transcriptional LysR family regulator
MNLSHLYYFKKLAELQHYTQAAQELYITQPSLSGAISLLESELGIALFEKKGRNVYLTKYGREFYGYVCESLQTLEKGIEIAKDHAGSLSGVVDIGSISTIQGDYLPLVLRSFHEDINPHVNFSIHQEQTNAIISAVESGKWDVGFCSYVKGKPDLFFVPVLRQSLIAAVRKSHPLAKEKSVYFSQLKDFNLISYHLEQPIGQQVNALLTEHGLEASQQYSNEIDIAGSTLLSNDVAIMLRTPAIREFDDLVVIQLPEVPDDFRIVHMVFQRQGYKIHAVENFIDYVAAYWSYSPENPRSQQVD